MEVQLKNEKIIVSGGPAYRHSEEAIRQSMQRTKRTLMENPGKTLAELVPFLPKDKSDRQETLVRSHWDEIEV